MCPCTVGPSTAQRLHDMAALHPDLAEAYTRKANKVAERTRDREDRGLIEKLLNELEVVLDEVEKELGERKKAKDGGYYREVQQSLSIIKLNTS